MINKVIAVSSFLTSSLYATTQPNIIVFMADDLGWYDLNSYDNQVVQTPNIDALAREGCRFDKVFLTASSSSPSRCSIMTSLYPHETRAAELHQMLPYNQVLASTPLRKNGYFTACVGKWHIGDSVIRQFDAVNSEFKKKPELWGDNMVKMLESIPDNQPFFLWGTSFDPHRRYTDNTPKIHSENNILLPPYLPDLQEVRKDYADYYNEIARFDAHIGQVINYLKKRGVYENTVLVIMSDNGSPMPRSKTRTNQQGMRTPLIIRYPQKIKKGITCKALISSIDIMPTLLEWAGTKFENQISGKSFAHIFTSNLHHFRDYCFAEHNWHDFKAFERAIYSKEFILNINFLPHLPATPPNDVVTSKAYQSILKAKENISPLFWESLVAPRDSIELWKYETDPYCLNNVVLQKKYRKTANELQNRLIQHMKETTDVFPGDNNITPDSFDRNTGKRLPNANPAAIRESK